MKNSQKGFVLPLIIVIIAAVVIGSGVYIYKNKKNEVPPVVSNASSITILSPNGRETWKVGSQQKVQWSIKGIVKPEYRVVISVEPGNAPIKVVEATMSSSEFTVPKALCWGGDACEIITKSSDYRIRVALYDNEPCTGLCYPNPNSGKLLAQDEGNNYLTITN